MFSLFVCFALSKRTPEGIGLQVLNPADFRQEADTRGRNRLLILYEYNESDTDDDMQHLFDQAAGLAITFVGLDAVDFALLPSPNINYHRVIAYYPRGNEGFFRLTPNLLPFQASTRILHLGARILQMAARQAKAAKSPGIARVKKELRRVGRLLKHAVDDEKRANLNNTRNDLVSELVQLEKPEKREIRSIKLQNKLIANKTARYEANRAVREMKAKLCLESNCNKSIKKSKHKVLKKSIDAYRRSWRQSRLEEADYDAKEEKERIEWEKDEQARAFDEDSDELDQYWRFFKAAQSVGAEDDDVNVRVEFIEKMRVKRHQRQKKEGKYRPRDAEGNYLYDDPDIRVGVDDPDDLGLDPVDLSPIKSRAKSEEDAKTAEEEEPPAGPEDQFGGQYGDLL
jgi:hypothetical protein